MISIPFNGRNIFRFLPSLLFLVAALYFFPFPVTEIPSFGNLQIDTGIATIPTGHGRGGLYGLSVNGNNYACGTEFLPGECLSQSRDDARGKIVTIYWMEKKDLFGIPHRIAMQIEMANVVLLQYNQRVLSLTNRHLDFSSYFLFFLGLFFSICLIFVDRIYKNTSTRRAQ